MLSSDIIIIGGGLCGFVTALRIAQSHSNSQSTLRITILEAKETIGGRIKSTEQGIDLGGAWIWPHDSRSLNLVKELKIDTMQQPNGSDESISYNKDDQCIVVSSPKNNANPTLATQSVIFAIPPRRIINTITFPSRELQIPSSRHIQMQHQNIWMGAMAKVAIIYSNPWWRTTANPHFNINIVYIPNSEVKQVMDSSNDTAFALVIFGVPPTDTDESKIKTWTDSIVTDIKRLEMKLLGVGTPTEPVSVPWHSWRHDKFIFTDPPNGKSVFEHPRDRGNVVREPLRVKNEVGGVDARVFFAGSESDDVAPGYIEGAVRAGERVARELMESIRGKTLE
ncbi:hypothetical protein HDU76_004270 [Blyttiomyces sp. JEL0837]|nr:hypothetical protein HDU76_004270 [Blyttiomyces sp. JEL0837]